MSLVRAITLALVCLTSGLSLSGALLAQAPPPAKGVRFQTISPLELREWLTYLSSDELQGRQVFSEGYGIAAQYIAERLRQWGVKPLGENGTYFQIVKVRSYRVTRNSSVTIEGGASPMTFKDGDHVAFPAMAGGRQTVVLEGQPSARASIRRVPVIRPPGQADDLTPVLAPGGVRVDIAPTPERVDALLPPQVTADDQFFAALEAAGPSAKVTITIDNTYEPVTTQLTRNVVAIVEGSDARLKDTYVLIGAHLDHVGYAVSNADVRGQVNNPIAADRIWNGADDDGSGSTALMAIAKAFARGPKPRRSVVFVWHAGEEAGMQGSLYNADFPVVPLEKIQAQLNIDMIGRNRDNDPAQANTLFVIGADRISTDLHNLIVGTNAASRAPLTLDYEYNDPQDPNSFYTRSDHYAYAAKGIPIAFFFTGTHPDYHANSDSVDKILFEKQARIAQLIYQVGFGIAVSDRTLQRDAKGPRAGRNSVGTLK
jgi:hypothetical protein